MALHAVEAGRAVFFLFAFFALDRQVKGIRLPLKTITASFRVIGLAPVFIRPGRLFS